MTDYIEEYLANSLYHSHIMEETNISLFSLVTEDGVPIRKLFVSNLAGRTSFKDLIKLFSKYGNVESCFLRRNQGNTNYAFITFNSVEAAASARYDERIRLHNRDLRVLPADSWHQPDNIENRCYNIKDKSKSNKISNDIVYNFDYTQDGITDTNIQTLNDDCLIHIFLQLPIIDRVRIERVCKRWKALSQESWSSVKRLDLSMWGLSGLNQREISTSAIRKVLLRCGSYLNEINLSIVPYPLRQSTATIVAKLCPNLQRIDITGLVVSTSGINSLINNCHDITKFSLGSTTYVCDLDLQKLFKMNPKLRYFKAYNSKINGRCLLYLPLEAMEEIVLEYCTCLQEHLLAQAFAKLQNLKSLTMNRCIDISGNVIQAIGTNCTNLKALEVSCISFLLQSKDMLHIAQLTNLEVLKISMNALVTDEFFSNLASKCLRLKYLDIAECLLVTDISIAAVTALPKLEVLIINYLGLVTDINLQDTCNLKQLECRACKFTDKTMINFLEYAPQLELLDLSGCRNITNETLKEAATITVNRTNNTILKVFVGGTSVDLSTFDKVSPFLQIVNIDLSKREVKVENSTSI